ncbi:MAG TPA: tRNA (adenosine(37)-N6)-threonylcarbamoyltransferase complex ATPase subunit type 1 TsaE [Terriglobia bacterium]|nr:tRNA (adenosine(37)-N6)-threonylcarbamoyltransferase complex ATPase subunit type 1 TsaE [Terriglobia bacterium]
MKAKTHFEVVTHSPAETLEFGRGLARELHSPCLLLLEGDLGSGKTTLTKGIISGLGLAGEDEVTSPSFTLVHEYGRDQKAYHVDLYRIEGTRELATLGLEEIFSHPAIVIIEWGEKLEEKFRGPHLRIRMEHLASEDRKITVEHR